jgi:4-diphosphocytidyl-2-C-methyl-D-erythritol kinase
MKSGRGAQCASVKAYAKLNLFLDILGKREDGYHEILTTMCMIDLADDVQITVSEGEGISGVDSDNTAYKAAKLFNAKKHINIKITKKIPVMAGLGGSSADAAAVLRALNALFEEPFTLDELMQMGAEIGSDVPFLIHGGHALCKGTGTEIAEILPLPDCFFVIVKPDFECSTKEAYALFGANPPPKTQRQEGKIYNIFEYLYNNPEIERIKQQLLSLGGKNAGLTGSGSAVFGVFESFENAEKAYKCLDYDVKFIARPVGACNT